MKKMMGTWTLGLAVLTTVATIGVGCGPVATGRDDGAFEPSRERRVEGISSQYCNRIEQCGDIGPGQDFENYAECISDTESFFYDLWPADECSNGQIDSVAYEICYQEVQTYPCNADFFDVLDFFSDCGGGEGCIDPPKN